MNNDVLLAARYDMRDLRQKLRDQHCTGRLAPPSDYNLVVSASCRPRKGTAAAASMKTDGKKKDKKPSSNSFDAQTNLKELRQVVEFLRTELRPPNEAHASNFISVVPIFDEMVDKKIRARYPNPLVRYGKIIRKFQEEETVRVQTKTTKTGHTEKDVTILNFDTNLPRYTVFMLLLSHLQNLELPEETPDELIRYHPRTFPDPPVNKPSSVKK